MKRYLKPASLYQEILEKLLISEKRVNVRMDKSNIHQAKINKKFVLQAFCMIYPPDNSFTV
jgi:hypothetical protein